MKIERAELREIRMRLRERFEISSGARQDRRILLVTLHGDGVEGWGECVAAEDPSYSYETTETAWHVLTGFVLPVILGREVADPAELMAPVGWIRGHRMAKAAVEMAAWDLLARTRDLPLARLLGGERDEVPVGVSVGIQPDDGALVEKVARHLEEGYRKIKVKIKPGRDVETLTLLRERFPEAPLMADANSAYTLDDGVRLQGLEGLDLLMIEQPLGHEDYLDHARLQARLRTPVCLDESIRSVHDARLALALGSCRIINIKPGRVGGFAEALAIHELCRPQGIPVWCGGMLESGIGRAHNVALATLPGFTLPGDISESRRYWEEDVVEPEFVMKDGMMRVPGGPGIGVEPRRDRIEELTVRRAAISA